MKKPSSVLFAALFLATVHLSVQHGYLEFPPSRQLQAGFDCPHCGQGGGAGRTPSICGDPFQNVDSNPSFVPFTDRFYGTTTLTAGSVVNIKLVISTNHGGRMAMAICPLPRGQVTQECFDRPENRLRRVDSNPEYNNKWYWYLGTNNMQSAETDYKLPDGVTCEGGCMMQWWWVGYQSCTLRCEDDSVDVPSQCNFNPLNPSVSTCPDLGPTEQYYNCADIVLVSDGNDNAPPSRPSQSPETAPPSPGPSPSPDAPSPPPPQPPYLTKSPFLPSYPDPPPPPKSPRPAGSPTPPPPQESSPSPFPRLPPPSPPVPPHPSPGGPKCDPMRDWICRGCTDGASELPNADGLVEDCVECGNADSVNDKSACWKCLDTVSHNPDVISGCMSCLVAGTPAFECQTYCADQATDGEQMSACASCVSGGGSSPLACGNCMSAGGDLHTTTDAEAAGGDMSWQFTRQCLSCVENGAESWACGKCIEVLRSRNLQHSLECLACVENQIPGWACVKCATRSDPTSCYSCLADATDSPNPSSSISACVD